MTREEAIKHLKEMKDECNDTIHKVRYVTQEEALEMAIKALEQNESAEEWYKLFVEKLEQEPSGDLISRQAVQDYIAKYLSQYLYDDVREAVEVIDEFIGDLPSVNPQKTGHWIMTSDYLTTAYGSVDYVKCSCCGEDSLEEGDYCPNCGARMFEQERSDKE